ncbi:hypothetical protein ACP70R_038519 [Stipagrostis hirtigluma subsp. patula]
MEPNADESQLPDLNGESWEEWLEEEEQIGEAMFAVAADLGVPVEVDLGTQASTAAVDLRAPVVEADGAGHLLSRRLGSYKVPRPLGAGRGEVLAGGSVAGAGRGDSVDGPGRGGAGRGCLGRATAGGSTGRGGAAMAGRGIAGRGRGGVIHGGSASSAGGGRGRSTAEGRGRAAGGRGRAAAGAQAASVRGAVETVVGLGASLRAVLTKELGILDIS